MIRKDITIGNDNWYIILYYNIQNEEDISEIVTTLSRFNCKVKDIKSISSLLRGINHGVTVTLPPRRVSIVCIGRTSEMSQFANTLIHEIDHVQNHICDYYNVDNSSEQAAYLIGYIASKVYLAITN